MVWSLQQLTTLLRSPIAVVCTQLTKTAPVKEGKARQIESSQDDFGRSNDQLYLYITYIDILYEENVLLQYTYTVSELEISMKLHGCVTGMQGGRDMLNLNEFIGNSQEGELHVVCPKTQTTDNHE